MKEKKESWELRRMTHRVLTYQVGVGLNPNRLTAPCSALLINIQADCPGARFVSVGFNICVFSLHVPDPVPMFQGRCGTLTQRNHSPSIYCNYCKASGGPPLPSLVTGPHPSCQNGSFIASIQDCPRSANGMGQVSAWTGGKQRDTSGW